MTLRWHTENSIPEGVTICPGVGTVVENGSMEILPTETTTFTLKLTVPSLKSVIESVSVTIRSQSSQSLKNQVLQVRVKRPDGGWRYGKGFSLRDCDVSDLLLLMRNG